MLLRSSHGFLYPYPSGGFDFCLSLRVSLLNVFDNSISVRIDHALCCDSRMWQITYFSMSASFFIFMGLVACISCINDSSLVELLG
jgi:hypothetical protein